MGEPTNNSLAVVTLSDTDFADNAWGKLFFGTAAANARAPSGNYFYRLDAYFATDCAGPVQASFPILNAFKVRATHALVSGVTGTFGVIGSDLNGPFAALKPDPNSTRDTTYDGSFDFFIDVGAASQEILLRDADADVVTDDDPSVSGPFGPMDVKSPGVAVGASDGIKYTLFDPSGGPRYVDPNPSGNFDDSQGMTDEEEHVVSTNGDAGAWAWQWDGVLTLNQVEIWVPKASPSTYEMFPAPAHRLPVTSARSTGSWTQDPRTLARFLPVALGEGDSKLVVLTEPQAVFLLGAPPSIFSPRLVDVCENMTHHPHLISVSQFAISALVAHGADLTRPEAISQLIAELLAARFNVSLGTSRGEDLLSGHVYGTDRTIQDVLSVGDSELVLGDDICALTASELSDVLNTERLLSAINAGDVSYQPITTAASTMHAAPVRSSARAPIVAPELAR